jgi:FkbM family methyltransferase
MGKRKLWIFSRAEVTVMATAMVLAIPLSAVASLHFSLVPMYGFLTRIGRGGGCSLASSANILDEIERMNDSIRRLHATSHVDLKDKDLERWQTPHGVFWAPLKTSVPYLLSEQLTRFYGDGERRVRKGDIVIDCGANIGTFVWEALSAGASLVVAVEPSERNVECLRRNYAREIEQGRVIVYPKGVWDKDDTLTFNVYENSALDSIVMESRDEEDKKPRKISIPVTTVDKIVAELKLDRVDFIKMDIEGAERNALEGSRATIQRFRPRMSIATENLPDDPEVVKAVVERLQPDYQVECGRCTRKNVTQLQADVYYFF